MIETKALIIHQILKLNKPFKPRHIWEPLGISPQNLNNHLVNMVDKGILSKNGTIYALANQELLVDELASVSEKSRLELPEPTILWVESNTNNLKNLLYFAVTARALGKEFSGPLTVGINSEIDSTIEELKKAKKFLNRKAYSEDRAKKIYENAQELVNSVWTAFGPKYLEEYMTHGKYKDEALIERKKEV